MGLGSSAGGTGAVDSDIPEPPGPVLIVTPPISLTGLEVYTAGGFGYSFFGGT